MIRPVENIALQKQTTVDAAVNASARQLGIVNAARGGADLGATNETGVVTYPFFPTIDPITGLPDIEPVEVSYWRAGDLAGSKPVG